ncbi:uncharacterized protein B0P05DRAFT_562988 [Gilbertella persicaria]|uniref:uncharacterized protein n=1 Tax=Gilbertella persicaria TaxID=101096 RepID=UPI002220166F|nr:uncharacterized protein B0P05DRAFT_562988 [Gilbertella persicaria]KAI8050639.1 hypothetical protein B0P05DRAFT_562988 [Gilbertella persicaria]
MMNINMSKPYSATTRRRTHLKPSQVAVLQEAFVTNTLPDATTRVQLAQELGVTERTVQIWFQNRRAKARKLEALSPGAPSLVPNVRTGWVDLSQSHQKRSQSLLLLAQKESPLMKRRPRSSSKPERSSVTFAVPTKRAMSEGIHIVESQNNPPQPSHPKSFVSFAVQNIRIGTWARFARQLNLHEWDLYCYSDPCSRQLIWQVQDAGHQFRIEIDYDQIRHIRLGQIQLDIGQLEIGVQSVSFSMRSQGESEWVRCNDFTENQQASHPESISHALQGSHDHLRQSLLELVSQAPELASKLVIVPDCFVRDLTISPSATPEPVNHYLQTTHYEPVKNNTWSPFLVDCLDWQQSNTPEDLLNSFV